MYIPFSGSGFLFGFGVWQATHWVASGLLLSRQLSHVHEPAAGLNIFTRSVVLVACVSVEEIMFQISASKEGQIPIHHANVANSVNDGRSDSLTHTLTMRESHVASLVKFQPVV